MLSAGLLLNSAQKTLCVIATEKGDPECKDNKFGNPLSLFTEGFDGNCKDDELNAIFTPEVRPLIFQWASSHNYLYFD